MGYDFILHVPDLNACPNACVRPVGLAFDRLGRLFVSSDSTGEVRDRYHASNHSMLISDIFKGVFHCTSMNKIVHVKKGCKQSGSAIMFKYLIINKK